MLSRRITLPLLVVLVLALALFGGVLAARHLLDSQGIRILDWGGPGISTDGVSLERLELQREDAEGSRLQLRGEALRVGWPVRADGGWRLRHLSGSRLQLDWQPAASDSAEPALGLPLPQQLAEWLELLPDSLDIHSLSLDLPCASGRCVLDGSLNGNRKSGVTTLGAQLQKADQRLLLQGSVSSGPAGVQVAAAAQLAEPLVLPGYGRLRGNLQLAADGVAEGWLPRTLDADLQLEELQGSWLQAVPAELRPQTLALRLWLPEGERTPSALPPVRFDLRGSGISSSSFEGELGVSSLEPWGLELRDARLQMRAPRLALAGVKASGASVDLRLGGSIGREAASLQFADAVQLRADSLTAPEGVEIRQLSGDLSRARLDLGYAADQPVSFTLDSQLRVQAGSLRQASLQPLGWSFAGKLAATMQQLSLQGRLENRGGLAADVDLQRQEKGDLRLKARFQEIFFRAGNPLAKTLRDWPVLLTLSNGRLNASADWNLPAGSAPQELALGLDARGLEGIHDRSEFQGLDAQADVRLRGTALTADLPKLEVRRLNPGVELGPLQFRGRYRAALATPLAGRLDWQQAQLQLFGGRAWLAPAGIELAQAEQALTLHLEGVRLEEILRAYPAEGLAGTGILDGELPMRVDRRGVRISGGRVAARQPGVLQFRSEKIRALGRSNPAMQLVASTLDDFRYDQLSSQVDYDESGRLLLALNLRGRNPSVEQGRPINLNVNLEENLPTLLTSLQLSDRVSETIRQRVQERLRQEKPATP
ncbi:Dicarboxylate transport [compost metagenome]